MNFSEPLQRHPASWRTSSWLPAMAVVAALLLGVGRNSLQAETGQDTWLRYARLDPRAAAMYSSLPRIVVSSGDSAVLNLARQELILGLHEILGGDFRSAATLQQRPVFLVGTIDSLGTVVGDMISPLNLSEYGYWIAEANLGGSPCILITPKSERGVLYGVFALLSKIARGEALQSFYETQAPAYTVRMVDQWDNLDGTIERGYARLSLFFENGRVREDLSRAGQYGRLLASLGINTCAINNVNANPRLLEKPFLPQLRRIAEAFRP